MPGMILVWMDIIDLPPAYSMDVELMTLAEVYDLITHLRHIRSLPWQRSSEPLWRAIFIRQLLDVLLVCPECLLLLAMATKKWRSICKLRPEKYGWNFADNIFNYLSFKRIFFFLIQIFTLVYRTAWCQTAAKPSSEPILTKVCDAIGHHHASRVKWANVDPSVYK